MIRLLHYVKTHKFFLFAVLVAVAIGAWFYLRPPSAPSYESAVVIRGDVVQEVSVTGRVESEQEVDLAFERGGRVLSEPVKVGTRVKAGDILVRLDASELAASRAMAQANLDYELVRLEEVKRGARPEEIAISASQVKSAENALLDASLGLSDKLKLAIDALDDAVFAKTDPLFEGPRTAPHFLIPIPDAKTIAELESNRVEIGEGLKRREAAALNLSASVALEKENLTLVRSYFDTLLVALSVMSPSATYAGNTIDGWKTVVNAARTSLSSAQTALLVSEEKFRSAERALEIAENELALKKAPATAETIAAQEAKIASVRATLANYDAQIAKVTLVAPFSGVVTAQSAKLGATIAPNAPVVTMQSDGAFKITANVPEVDVAKIAAGDKADVTLDAYGSETFFPATVVLIDPAETVIEGVPTYKVTLYFDKKDERIRSGMTANLDILTEKREGVLKIPARAVVGKNGAKTVRVPSLQGAEEVTVETGLRGSDGMIEILSGLSEGDLVITFGGK